MARRDRSRGWTGSFADIPSRKQEERQSMTDEHSSGDMRTLRSSNLVVSMSAQIVSLLNDSVVPALNDTIAASSSDPQEAALRAAAQSAHVLMVFFVMNFSVLWLLCVALVIHVRYNRAAAFKGNDVAARKIILPTFEPLLIVLGFLNFAFALFLSITLLTGFYDTSVPPVVLESVYTGHQFALMLILVFMLQKSLSIPALRRAVAIAFVTSVYTVPYIWWINANGEPSKQLYFLKWLHVLRALSMLLSVYIIIWPPSRATKRTLRELAIYNILRYLLTTVYMLMATYPATRENSRYALYVTLTWIAFTPLVIWRVLKADTGYWRGMGQRACALQSVFRQKTQMHEKVSSEGLHVLIEMHRKYIIDFAHLDLRQQIGVGTTSTVFQGVLQSRLRVAVKVYQPCNFTEDVVAGFSHEAALCGLLHHPNIVQFLGMCVSPPTVCLVFELCQGSLQDILHAQTQHQYQSSRQQLLISVGYMLDAARAIAYLHSFSPPFIHRDIKPSNFLVDVDCNVKLSDFGESRTLTKLAEADMPTRNQPQQPAVMTRNRNQVRDFRDSDRYSTAAVGMWVAMASTPNTIRSPVTETLDAALESRSSSLSSSSPSHAVRGTQWSTDMTVKGTADYMAPEVIRGKGGVASYDQAADVYSLAITMWDILHPDVDKFAASNASHLYVFEHVLRGNRPTLDPRLPPSLRDVIRRAWQGEAHLRPTALEVVSVLQEVQETLCAALVVDVMYELQLCSSHANNADESTISSDISDSMFSGVAATDALLERSFVSSVVEATRMGNAWMDAGMLHHVRHAHAFKSSGASLYYFDADTSDQLRQATAARTSRSSETSSGIPMLVAPSTPPVQSRSHHGGNHRRGVSRNSSNTTGNNAQTLVCSCRRFAQRLVDERPARGWRRKLSLRDPAAPPLRSPAPLLFSAKQQQPSEVAQDDDLVLTTALLMADERPSGDADGGDAFGSFVDYGGGSASRVNVQRS